MNYKRARFKRSAKRAYVRHDRRLSKLTGYRRMPKRHYRKHGHGPP